MLYNQNSLPFAPFLRHATFNEHFAVVIDVVGKIRSQVESRFYLGECGEPHFTYDLGQNSLGKCDALICLCDEVLLSPLSPFQCWLKNTTKGLHNILHHIFNIGMGRRWEDQYTF